MWHDRRVADSPDGPAAGLSADHANGRTRAPALWCRHLRHTSSSRSSRAASGVPTTRSGSAAGRCFSALLLFIGDVALGTTAGLEEDLTTAITRLPDLILTFLALRQ